MPPPTRRPDPIRPMRRPVMAASAPVPPLLRDYMDNAADLIRELEARYQSPPLMSLFRASETPTGLRTAVLATQDGAATLTVELNPQTATLDWTYRLASMLGLRFSVPGLSDMDQERWLDIMRDGDSEPAFLWTPQRWNADYIICSSHRYYTNVFAFSARHAEAAARLTPEAARKLLDWLQAGWFPPTPDTPALDW